MSDKTKAFEAQLVRLQPHVDWIREVLLKSKAKIEADDSSMYGKSSSTYAHWELPGHHSLIKGDIDVELLHVGGFVYLRVQVALRGQTVRASIESVKFYHEFCAGVLEIAEVIQDYINLTEFSFEAASEKAAALAKS